MNDNSISGTYTLAPYPCFVNGLIYWIQNNENNNAIWFNPSKLEYTRSCWWIIGHKKDAGSRSGLIKGYYILGFDKDRNENIPSWPNEVDKWETSKNKPVKLNVHVPGR